MFHKYGCVAMHATKPLVIILIMRYLGYNSRKTQPEYELMEGKSSGICGIAIRDFLSFHYGEFLKNKE